MENRQAAIAAGAVDDLGFDPSQMDGEGIARHLERRVTETLNEVTSSSVWRVVVDPASEPGLVIATLREIYLEIAMYQPDSIEAAVASIGQMPRSMPARLVEEMLHHQVEEFDHGEMALRDYVGFHGDESFARQRRQSPSAFSVAAVWRNITHTRDPFAYLGAVYLFDGLTPVVTDMVMKELGNRLELRSGLEFISHHAIADVEHTAQIRALIVEVANLYQEAKTAIVYGYEYFHHVYPLPVWDAARCRAVRSLPSAKAVVAS